MNRCACRTESTSPLHKVAHGGRRFDHSSAQRAADSRGETLEQLLDRNLAELLQELRVAFTGVQILFAFLLSLAFTQRFTELDGFDIAVYVVALLSTALATMVLIAPVSFHRIVFRRGQKAALVVVADRLLMRGSGPAHPGDLQRRPADPRRRARPVAGDRGLLRHRAGRTGDLVRASTGGPPCRP